MAVFDIDSDDIAETMAIFDRERATMPSTPALDLNSVSLRLFRAVGPLRRG